MSADILDSILNPRARVSTGLQKVIDFVSKNRLAYDVGGKCVVGTTCGIAHVGALKPATELMQRAMCGDPKAKEWVALFKAKADAGDPWAQKVMGLLDVTAIALRDYECDPVEVGKKKKPEPLVTVTRVDGSTLSMRKSKAHKYLKVHPGSSWKPYGVTQPQRPGQPATQPQVDEYGEPQVDGPPDATVTVMRADGTTLQLKRYRATKYVKDHPGSRILAPGQAGQPQRRPPQRRPGQPGGQLVNQQQIAQSMQGMTPQQQQLFQQNLLAQQQANLQSGMFGPQGYPGGMYGQPMPQGIPQYYGPAMAPGRQGMFAADEAFDDGTFQEEPAPGDVQFADEGADSTEQTE